MHSQSVKIHKRMSGKKILKVQNFLRICHFDLNFLKISEFLRLAKAFIAMKFKTGVVFDQLNSLGQNTSQVGESETLNN